MIYGENGKKTQTWQAWDWITRMLASNPAIVRSNKTIEYNILGCKIMPISKNEHRTIWSVSFPGVNVSRSWFTFSDEVISVVARVDGDGRLLSVKQPAVAVPTRNGRHLIGSAFSSFSAARDRAHG
jgi:hypothetical protein